jgi:ER-bound oxygenase mpaB/B'/Rubber oxygenase, catalytic domain
VLLARDWHLGEEGLPCNQEELAYTLLTFGYVFLRGMRQLGLALPPSDEAAYLHLWNVVGHILGIRDELLPHSMDDAAALFDHIQYRAARDKVGLPGQPDPRPALGAALIHSMQAAMPLRLFQSVPVLLTRYLCGSSTAALIGVNQHVSWLSTALFFIAMGMVRLLDSVVGFFLPGFALSRMLTRVVGYHLMRKILLDQTRPLKLPDHLITQVGASMGQWSDDALAPGWLNRLEDKLTRVGDWNAPKSNAPGGSTPT